LQARKIKKERIIVTTESSFMSGSLCIDGQAGCQWSQPEWMFVGNMLGYSKFDAGKQKK
jgi:hypothetical protein